ncbi:MAG TPA: CoA transferase, partial [Acetobacteraceae bacterium]|nr:CoA transferase [Acetobacteraceae bacterium]
NDHPTGIPTGVFPASDGVINLAASSGRQWARFCEVLGRQDWAEKPQWQTQKGRSADRAALNAAIAEMTRTRSVAEWVAVFAEAGIPCGPINTIDKVFADPQVEHQHIARPVEHPRLGTQRLVASPLTLAGVPKDLRGAAPDAGADTDAVLREAGYDDAALARMRAKGVIG